MRKLVLLLFPLSFFSQPFTKKYLLAFHSCTTNCAPQFHQTHIAESNDGTNWSMVPNLPYLPGSVPDIIIRGSKLYLYNPGKLIRYNNTTSVWDSSPSGVSIADTNGNAVMFVDPSPIVDSSGNIVLFFLNSTGTTGDPATCSSYPCTKYFDSATEVPGSDGTQFILNSGHRFTATINSGTASDPDIFFDGSQYIMYYSAGSNTKAFYSSSLHGSYASFPGLTNGDLTNQGGIPCGHYDSTSAQYWTYAHAGGGTGVTEIRKITHANLNTTVNSFVTVITGTTIGLTASHKCESPGFCLNDFLSVGISSFNNELNISVFPNPATTSISIQSDAAIKSVTLFSVTGELVNSLMSAKQNLQFELETKCAAGIYFLRIVTCGGAVTKKIIIQ